MKATIINKMLEVNRKIRIIQHETAEIYGLCAEFAYRTFLDLTTK